MVDLINNHVLFPELANWSQPPSWRRIWQNMVSSAVTGAESRLAVRSEPRITLSFLITRGQLPEIARFDDRLRAAKKSGLACAPFCGRGYVLQTDCSAAAATLDRDWNSAFAPYVFFSNAAGSYEVRSVTAIADNVVTLDQAVARTYRAGTFCWPLILGKFTCEDFTAFNASVGELKLTITELVSPASAQLGEITEPAGDGIGIMTVADTLEVQ